VQAKTDEQRHAAAGRCVEGLGLSLRTVVDDLSDTTMTAWAAWPDRLYVVGVDGKVVFAGEPGPFGFDVDSWGEAIATAAKAAPGGR